MNSIDSVRQQFVQLLSNAVDSQLATIYQVVYPTKCPDQDAMAYMEKLEAHFVYYARQMSEARVVSASVVTDVKFNKNKRIISELTVSAVVIIPNQKRILAKSFQDFCTGIIDRLFKSFANKFSYVQLNARAAFQLINKMLGNEVLYALQTSIDNTVRDARADAMHRGVREEAEISFREKHRAKYTSDLAKYLRDHVPPGLLEEEDFQQAWREFIVADVMEEEPREESC